MYTLIYYVNNLCNVINNSFISKIPFLTINYILLTTHNIKNNKDINNNYIFINSFYFILFYFNLIFLLLNYLIFNMINIYDFFLYYIYDANYNIILFNNNDLTLFVMKGGI